MDGPVGAVGNGDDGDETSGPWLSVARGIAMARAAGDPYVEVEEEAHQEVLLDLETFEDPIILGEDDASTVFISGGSDNGSIVLISDEEGDDDAAVDDVLLLSDADDAGILDAAEGSTASVLAGYDADDEDESSDVW